MIRTFLSSAPIAWGVLFLALWAGGCQTTPPETAPPKPVEFTDQESIEATVIAVDAAAKVVTLQGPDGSEVTMRVPEARNLAQVEVGDTLRVSYFATYRASVAAPGESKSDMAVAGMRAPEGERPGAFVAVGGATTVEIISVSEDGSLVSFRDEEGRLDSMTVMRDEGRAFARSLKRGDMIVLEYAEAVAIDVEESGS